MAVFRQSDKTGAPEDEADSTAEHRARAEGAEGTSPCASCRPSPEAPTAFPEHPSFRRGWGSNARNKEKRSLGHKREIHLPKTYYVLEIYTAALGNELKLENSPPPNWATTLPFNREAELRLREVKGLA